MRTRSGRRGGRHAQIMATLDSTKDQVAARPFPAVHHFVSMDWRYRVGYGREYTGEVWVSEEMDDG